MSKKNSVCKLDPTKTDGSKKHKMSKKVDGQGRTFESCDKCGAVYVGKI